jgi:hypothetical protein
VSVDAASNHSSVAIVYAGFAGEGGPDALTQVGACRGETPLPGCPALPAAIPPSPPILSTASASAGSFRRCEPIWAPPLHGLPAGVGGCDCDGQHEHAGGSRPDLPIFQQQPSAVSLREWPQLYLLCHGCGFLYPGQCGHRFPVRCKGSRGPAPGPGGLGRVPLLALLPPTNPLQAETGAGESSWQAAKRMAQPDPLLLDAPRFA